MDYSGNPDLGLTLGSDPDTSEFSFVPLEWVCIGAQIKCPHQAPVVWTLDQ